MTDPATVYTPTPANLGSESSLSSWAGPYVTEMLGQGFAVANQDYQNYEGQLTAGTSDLQQQAFDGIAGLSAGPMNQFETSSFTDEGVAEQYMNPYLESSLNPQIAEMERQADITRLENNNALTQAGAFGGSRQAIMNSELDRNTATGIGDLRYTAYADAFDNAQNQYNTEQGLNLNASQYNNALSGDILGLQADAGATQRGIEAEGIAADKAQFEEERDDPYKQVQFMQSLLQEMPLEAQTQIVEQQNPLNAGIGTAGGIIDLLNQLFP